MRTGTKKAESMFMVVAKGALLGVALSLVLLLLFSLALDREWVQLKSMRTATIAIKTLSAVAAAVFALKKYKGRAMLTGVLTGIAYACLAFLFFSILAEQFSFSIAILGDFGIGGLCGAAAAVFLRVFDK